MNDAMKKEIDTTLTESKILDPESRKYFHDAVDAVVAMMMLPLNSQDRSNMHLDIAERAVLKAADILHAESEFAIADKPWLTIEVSMAFLIAKMAMMMAGKAEGDTAEIMRRVFDAAEHILKGDQPGMAVLKVPNVPADATRQ